MKEERKQAVGEFVERNKFVIGYVVGATVVTATRFMVDTYLERKGFRNVRPIKTDDGVELLQDVAGRLWKIEFPELTEG